MDNILQKDVREADSDNVKYIVEILNQSEEHRKLLRDIVAGDRSIEEFTGFLQIVLEDEDPNVDSGKVMTYVTSLGSLAAILTGVSSLLRTAAEEGLSRNDEKILSYVVGTIVDPLTVLVKAKNPNITNKEVRDQLEQLMQFLIGDGGEQDKLH